PQVLGLSTGRLQDGFDRGPGGLVEPTTTWLRQFLPQLSPQASDSVVVICVIVSLIFIKLLATSLTLGSGGSGGTISPGLVIGGFLGMAYWQVLRFLPLEAIGVGNSPNAFMIVGMASYLAGIGRAPLGFSLLAIQLTGQYSLLIPALLAALLARLVV